MNHDLAIGRIVMYCWAEQDKRSSYRAAMVTLVHGIGTVNLTIFTDVEKDSWTGPFARDACCSHGTKPGQWLWPDELPEETL